MYSLPLLSRSAVMEGETSFSSTSNSSTGNEEHEYVWDGFTHEQLAATPIYPGDGYYEDLELAARLGKTLLQKNKELDTLNFQLKCCNEEQSLEIEHLNKQVSFLREVNESKSRMFEQLDMNYQDLEATNRKLKMETREWKERLTKCMNVCESQDDQIQSLKSEVESVRKMYEGKKAKERMRRRTIHGCLPTCEQDEVDIQRFLETSAEFNNSWKEKEEKKKALLAEQEVAALHDVVRNLRAQQIMDKRMVKELRKELESVLQENQDFYEKLQEEREMTQRLHRIVEEYDKVVYRQAFVAESTPNITAELTNGEIDFSDHSEDEEALTRQQEENSVSLLGGTMKSSFQSPCIKVHTPISQYLQIANSTPLRSPISCQPSETDPTSPSVSQQGEGSEDLHPPCSTVKTEPKNVSLVQELDTQYKALLGKYESLLRSIESEKVSSPSKENHPESSRSCNGTSPSLSPEPCHASNTGTTDYVPEYKKIFRELFKMINEVKA